MKAQTTVIIRDEVSAYYNYPATVISIHPGDIAWVEVSSGTGSIGMAVAVSDLEEATLSDMKVQLTLKFAGGRRPSNKGMGVVEALRDQISAMEYIARKDVSGCKS